MNEAAAIKRQLLNFARGYLVVGERGLSLHQSDWGHFSPKHNISAPMLGVVNQFSILCHGSVAELDLLSKHGFSFFFLFLFHQMNGYKANPACIKPASLRSQNTKRFRQKSLSITFIDTNFYENHYGFRRFGDLHTNNEVLIWSEQLIFSSNIYSQRHRGSLGFTQNSFNSWD